MDAYAITMDHEAVAEALATGSIMPDQVADDAPEAAVTGFWNIEFQTFYMDAPAFMLAGAGDVAVIEGETAEAALAAAGEVLDYSVDSGDYQILRAVPCDEPEPEAEIEPVYPEIGIETTVRDLRAALAACGKIVGAGGHAIPILHCVLFDASESSVTVTGTDLDCTVTAEMPVSAASAGQCAVNFKELRKCLTKRPVGEAVTILADGTASRVTVTVGMAQHVLTAFGPGDWPRPVAVDSGEIAEIGAADLHSVLTDVQAAMSSEETRYYLNGALLERGPDDTLQAVATDGHRMHVRSTDVAWPDMGFAEIDADTDEMVGRKSQVILPRVAVERLAVLTKDSAGDVMVESDGCRADFVGDGWQVRTKLVDGLYPDWQRVVPDAASRDEIATVQPGPVADVCRALGNTAATFRWADAEIRAKQHGSRHGGDFTESVYPLARVNGACALEQIGMNAHYVGQLMERFDPDGEADFRMADAGSPILVTAAARPEFRAVVMPMRV
ncbi:MAG: hypothetical protein F4233_06630 [Rhodospirillaceae bacterium]|nr:hypothetical protein [Rhodospirillaceae bacterium]